MKNFFCYVCLAVLCCAAGCSDKVSSQGTVKFSDGTPLGVGTVFLSNDMLMYQGTIRPDGTFSIGEIKDGDGVPPGTYKVWISGANTTEDVYENKGKDNEKIVKRIEHVIIKPKFTEKETSGLTFTVEKGEKNQIEIVVEKP